MALRGLIPAPAPGNLRRRLVGAAILGGVVTTGIALNAVAAPCVDNVRPVAATLEARGISVVYGDYWMVYRLAYVSDERLIPVAMLPDLAYGLNRYPPYLTLAHRSHRPAWIVYAGSAMERNLVSCLAQRHSRVIETSIGGYRVFGGVGWCSVRRPSLR
jgi:hypothetical protein